MTKTPAEQKRDDYVRRLVEQAPPLSDEQRIRLSQLITQEAASDPPLSAEQRSRLGAIFGSARPAPRSALDEMLGGQS